MNINQRYCFATFGELALDITYNDSGVIKECGGVSSFNTLYHLATFGEETYALGGVGSDINGIKSIQSLNKAHVNTKYIQTLNKDTNVFYIYKHNENIINDNDVTIGRVSPITGEKSINWSNDISVNFPQELKNRNLILIVSNFEPVTREFVKKAKTECLNCKVSIDITNGMIFSKYSASEIWEYLKNMDFIQCSEKTFEILKDKLNIEDENSFIQNLNAQIFTMTKGKNGADFYYRNDEKIYYTNKMPDEIVSLVDPTGAGDAFHALLLMSYCRKEYNKDKLDEDYFDKAFTIANTFSKKIVQIEGARSEPHETLKYMIEQIKNMPECQGHEEI